MMVLDCQADAHSHSSAAACAVWRLYLVAAVQTCMGMDEVLFSLAEDVKNFAVVYLVDITETPDFNVSGLRRTCASCCVLQSSETNGDHSADQCEGRAATTTTTTTTAA